MSLREKRPWCIEWSAALFIAIAAFSTIVHIGSRSRTEALADWPKYVVEWVIIGAIALAVASGWRSIRVLFACAAIFSLPEFIGYWTQSPWIIPVAWLLNTLVFMILLGTRHLGIGISIFFGCAVVSVVAHAFRPLIKIKKSTPADWDFGVEAMIVIAAALCFFPAATRYFNDRSKPNTTPDPSRPSVEQKT